jgi:hypothetical protein
VLSPDFHCKENEGFRVVPIHTELVTSNYGVHEVEVTVCGILGGINSEVRVDKLLRQGIVVWRIRLIQDGGEGSTF